MQESSIPVCVNVCDSCENSLQNKRMCSHDLCSFQYIYSLLSWAKHITGWRLLCRHLCLSACFLHIWFYKRESHCCPFLLSMVCTENWPGHLQNSTSCAVLVTLWCLACISRVCFRMQRHLTDLTIRGHLYRSEIHGSLPCCSCPLADSYSPGH